MLKVLMRKIIETLQEHIMISANKILLMLVVFIGILSTESAAKTLNHLDGYSQEVTTIVNNPKEKLVSVKSFNVEMEGCDADTKMMKIEKITMDADDQFPQKMSLRDMGNSRISMPTNFSSLDNASRSWTDSMFSEGDWVQVQYLICGSGGFPQMTSISKQTERFPKAGVTIK